MKLDTPELGKFLMDEIFVHDCYKLKELVGKPIDTIVDIGANNGVFALYARVLFPRANILAFEPANGSYIRLTDNMENLGVKCFKLGLGDGSDISLVPNSHIGDSGSFKGVAGNEAQTMIFEDLLEKHGVKPGPGTIIKIDCEGGERFMVKSEKSMGVLSQARRWMMEVHYHRKQWPECPDRGFYENFLKTYPAQYPFKLRADYNKQYGMIIADKITN
jgi:FkbM family methyltransferase